MQALLVHWDCAKDPRIQIYSSNSLHGSKLQAIVLQSPRPTRSDPQRVRMSSGERPIREGGGGGTSAGILRRGIFRVSNPCEISHTIFRRLCEINPLRNLAKCLVQQLPEHLETGYGGPCGSRGGVR